MLNPRLNALSPRSSSRAHDGKDTDFVRAKSVHLPPWLPEFLLREGAMRDLMPWAAILVWYLFNLTVIFINKQIFKHYPFPTTLALVTELIGWGITTGCLRLRIGKGSSKPQGLSFCQTAMSVLPISVSVSGNNFFSK
jgi:hypothetical protein